MPSPTVLYARLNKLIWKSRLPRAKIVVVEDAVIPKCYGITLFDQDFAKPVIFLNKNTPHHIGKTLTHEMIHVAEPELRHGIIFDMLVSLYWQKARKSIKGLSKL